MRLHLLLSALALSLGSVAAHADTMYVYTGTNFSNASYLYSTADKISGVFSLSAPLAPNLVFQSVDVSSFSFTNGLDTISSAMPNIAFFEFSTGATGAIDRWLISINVGGLPNGTRSILTRNFLYRTPIDSLFYDVTTGDGVDGQGAALGTTLDIGSLRLAEPSPAAITPEPSSFVLLGTGLLGAAGVLRKRFA